MYLSGAIIIFICLHCFQKCNLGTSRHGRSLAIFFFGSRVCKGKLPLDRIIIKTTFEQKLALSSLNANDEQVQMNKCPHSTFDVGLCIHNYISIPVSRNYICPIVADLCLQYLDIINI